MAIHANWHKLQAGKPTISSAWRLSRAADIPHSWLLEHCEPLGSASRQPGNERATSNPAPDLLQAGPLRVRKFAPFSQAIDVAGSYAYNLLSRSEEDFFKL